MKLLRNDVISRGSGIRPSAPVSTAKMRYKLKKRIEELERRGKAIMKERNTTQQHPELDAPGIGKFVPPPPKPAAAPSKPVVQDSDTDSSFSSSDTESDSANSSKDLFTVQKGPNIKPKVLRRELRKCLRMKVNSSSVSPPVNYRSPAAILALRLSRHLGVNLKTCLNAWRDNWRCYWRIWCALLAGSVFGEQRSDVTQRQLEELLLRQRVEMRKKLFDRSSVANDTLRAKIVQLEKEIEDCKEDSEEALETLQYQITFGEHLKNKVDRLSKVALEHGADRMAVEKIKNEEWRP